MRFPSLRRSRQPVLPGVTGVVRLDRRTKNLTKRLHPGDIAVIDHLDLDRVSAEALVACRAAAVLNVAPSISGRYPNLGPEILVEAGIPLLDIRPRESGSAGSGATSQRGSPAGRRGRHLRRGARGRVLFASTTTPSTGVRSWWPAVSC